MPKERRSGEDRKSRHSKSKKRKKDKRERGEREGRGSSSRSRRGSSKAVPSRDDKPNPKNRARRGAVPHEGKETPLSLKATSVDFLSRAPREIGEDLGKLTKKHAKQGSRIFGELGAVIQRANGTFELGERMPRLELESLVMLVDYASWALKEHITRDRSPGSKAPEGGAGVQAALEVVGQIIDAHAMDLVDAKGPQLLDRMKQLWADLREYAILCAEMFTLKGNISSLIGADKFLGVLPGGKGVNGDRQPERTTLMGRPLDSKDYTPAPLKPKEPRWGRMRAVQKIPLSGDFADLAQ